MRTGYGRTSSLNRIPYYRSSSSRGSRTYRGVRTRAMVSDMTTRMAKAQDTIMKDRLGAGQITLDQYTSYVSGRIAQTSDPLYRETLTSQLQGLVNTSNETQLSSGYKNGNVSAGQLADYYKQKLTGLTQGSPIYNTTQALATKWDRQNTTDSYGAQEAVLKGNLSGAPDQVGPASKLLDFYMQYLTKLTPGTPQYNTIIQAIGTTQGKVRTLTNQQNLLKAEDAVSRAYNTGTPQDFQAKAQMYSQLRDAAAAQGDINNYYKYDQLIQTNTDRATVAQTKVVAKQVHTAIATVHENYLSGKIDGATAQSQLMQITSAADSAGDVTGGLLAHDLYNTIESNVAHGVVYGSQGGFGKTKGGGSGDTGWFDLSSGTPMSGGGSTSSSGSRSSSGYGGSASASAPSAVSVKGGTTPATGAQSGSLLDQILTAARVSNPTQQIIDTLNTAHQQGASVANLVDLLRTMKVGTGDGWKALQDVQKTNTITLNGALQLGYDPQTGLPFNIADFQQATLGAATQMSMSYGQWGAYAQANPNAKININGTNTKVGTLTDTISKVLNGVTKVDPATGLETKESPGLVDTIANLSNPNSQMVVVENSKAPGTYMFQDKAAFQQAQGTLSNNYIQDETGVYHYVNSPRPQQTFWQDQASANAYAQKNKIPITNVQQNASGQWVVSQPNAQPRSVTVHGPNGQQIVYALSPDNQIIGVQGSKGALPAGFAPTSLKSFGGAQLSVPSDKMGFKSTSGQKLSAATPQAPANFSTMYGPRYASLPTNLPTASMVPANYSSKSGPVYVPPASPGAAPNFSPFPASMASKVVAPARPPQQVFTNPLDQLISAVTGSKPSAPNMPASNIPAGTQLNQPQPSSPTQLSVAGNSQPSSLASTFGGGHSIPAPNVPSYQPAPFKPNALAQFGSSVGSAISSGVNTVTNTLGNIGSGISNFLGGFHF